LPHRFEVLGEALISGSDVLDACAVAGQDLARDGASVQEALEGLRETCRQASGGDPSYEVVSALVTAWSETTLGDLHQLSCDDPLTGLASQAHLRSRLSELYRLADPDPVTGHALVLCAMPFGDDPSEEPGDHFTRAMRLARAGELARTVFARDETIARLGTHRVAVLARRDERLARRVRVLRTLLDSLEVEGASPAPPVRVWIEGLPTSDRGAGMLLDELARG
jgi:GGDEF domain-containing protein